MRDVNSWLMALSFLLGLGLTLLFTIRRVGLEVPIFGAGTAGAAGVATDGAAGAAGTPVSTLVDNAADFAVGPYAGSVKAGPGGAGPNGWTIKGNEDSMLYHTVDSPWYKQTIAEMWFREESAAKAAGFTRWDQGMKHKHSGGSAAPPASGGPVSTVLADFAVSEYGSDSVKAGPGGVGPDGWTVKGNADSMLYHTPESPAYEATIAEVWFREVSAAETAGFERWDSWRKKKK